MFTALHPLLLWGTAAVAVPVLIHLLLRQRPKPRPWAAMRWLLAAAQAAQRRYRLTNLLLLLLRCLAILLIALAVARPSIMGMGGGERLVLVVDISASMGARGTEPGPLALVKAALDQTPPSVSTAALVAVGQQVQVLADGPRAAVLEAVARLEASGIPGGLDRVADAAGSAVLSQVITSGSDVLLISDFQQDDGTRAVALCQGRCRSVARWCVGIAAPNALITGATVTGDAVPNQPGEVTIAVAGPVRGAAVAVDDGPFLAAPAIAAGSASLRLITPPLAEGAHRVRLRIDDDGLAYDNQVELPLLVRPAIPVLVVQERIDYLGAALAADPRSLASRSVRPAAAATEALPDHGLVALRAPLADASRLADWVRAGGVLWAPWRILADDARLRPLVAGVNLASDTVAGGEFQSGAADLDEVLRTGRRERVLRSALPATATVLLRAGAAPLVAVVPAERGAVIIELDDLAGDNAFVARGTTPAWVARTVRQMTARPTAPRSWQAGTPAPVATTLTRNGRSQALDQGAPLLIPPGLWRDAQGPVVVLPSREEGRLDRTMPTGAVANLEQALPRQPGRDWGLPLAVAALLIVLVEGLVAAWAGRRYGR